MSNTIIIPGPVTAGPGWAMIDGVGVSHLTAL